MVFVINDFFWSIKGLIKVSFWVFFWRGCTTEDAYFIIMFMISDD